MNNKLKWTISRDVSHNNLTYHCSLGILFKDKSLDPIFFFILYTLSTKHPLRPGWLPSSEVEGPLDHHSNGLDWSSSQVKAVFKSNKYDYIVIHIIRYHILINWSRPIQDHHLDQRHSIWTEVFSVYEPR